MVWLLWKTEWLFTKKLKIEFPYDSAIHFLGIHPPKLKAGSQRGICVPMFIVELFTTAEMWTQPTWPLIGE